MSGVAKGVASVVSNVSKTISKSVSSSTVPFLVPHKPKVGSGIHRNWHTADATGHVVGRLASQIARILVGKHKPSHLPHIDDGDFVIITNAERLILTGRKWEQKVYRWHTGWPGGLKELPIKQMYLKNPEKILVKAVYGMLPKNSHRDIRIKRLKIFMGAEHPHQLQVAASQTLPGTWNLFDSLWRTGKRDIDTEKYEGWNVEFSETPTDVVIDVEHQPGPKKVTFLTEGNCIHFDSPSQE